MSAMDELVPVLKRLRLSGVLETLRLRITQASEENLALEEFLFRLLHDEVERRDSKQLWLRLRRAQFETDRSLEDFDFTFNPKIPRAKIIELSTTAFVERNDNVLLLGPSGVGKSHIAQALGHRACRAAKAVLYTTASRMFSDLRSARADQSYDRKIERLCTPDLLIVDDLGLRALRDQEPEDLYEIIRRRYEHGSMVITSNRDVEEWYPLFGEPLLASAAMDRLLHHCHVVRMEGDSYRNPPPASSRRKKNEVAHAAV